MNLEDLRRLEAAATPGPWRTTLSDDDNGVTRPHIRGGKPEPMGLWIAAFYPYTDASETGSDNAALIAAARNALPALLRVAEAAKKLEQWRSERGSVVGNVALSGYAWDELAAALAALEAL